MGGGDYVPPTRSSWGYDVVISSCSCNAYLAYEIECILHAIYDDFEISSSDDDPASAKKKLADTRWLMVTVVNSRCQHQGYCRAKTEYAYKHQLPIIAVIDHADDASEFEWLGRVSDKIIGRSVDYSSEAFEANLFHTALELKRDSDQSKIRQPISIHVTEDSVASGSDEDWILVSSDAAKKCLQFRQIQSDPHKFESTRELEYFYRHYVQAFVLPRNRDLFDKSRQENDVIHLIRAYTSATGFCNLLNRHIASNILYFFDKTIYPDVDYCLVKFLYDFIQLVIHRQELKRPRYRFQGTVYRGMILSDDEVSRYIVGSQIINKTFLSTSKTKDVAQMFTSKDPRRVSVLCLYRIFNRRHRSALNISSISCFQNEEEILILPFTPFRITNVRRCDDRQHVEIELVEIDAVRTEDDSF